MTGKYYYGEANGKDSAELKKQAHALLINNISLHYLNQTNVSAFDSAISIKKIDYLVIPYGLGLKTIAYTDTQDVVIRRHRATKELNIVAIQTPEVSVPGKAKNGTISGSIQNNSVSISEQLKQFTKGSEAEKFLIINARKNILAFTSKRTLVTNEEDCYIMVIDASSDTVLALLSRGRQRTNMFTNIAVDNFQSEFPKADFVWIYVF